MAALKHRFSDDLMTYVSFGQGYKSGGFNGEVANNATHYQDEGLFGAETVDAWEVGLKGALGRYALIRSGRLLAGLRCAAGTHLRLLPAARRRRDHLQLPRQSGRRNRAGRGAVGPVAPV
jgi:hypothetical protein